METQRRELQRKPVGWNLGDSSPRRGLQGKRVGFRLGDSSTGYVRPPPPPPPPSEVAYWMQRDLLHPVPPVPPPRVVLTKTYHGPQAVSDDGSVYECRAVVAVHKKLIVPRQGQLVAVYQGEPIAYVGESELYQVFPEINWDQFPKNVWVILDNRNHDKRFHLKGRCSKNTKSMKIDRARDQGFTPCKNCFKWCYSSQ